MLDIPKKELDKYVHIKIQKTIEFNQMICRQVKYQLSN